MAVEELREQARRVVDEVAAPALLKADREQRTLIAENELGIRQ